MKSEKVQCPTFESPDEPLFAHTISCKMCEQLQASFYHKCSKCVYSSNQPHTGFESVHAVSRQSTPADRRPMVV